MYYALIVLTMLVLPIASVAMDPAGGGGATALAASALKWFTFWIGVRILVAGVVQMRKPGFTTRSILGIDDPRAYVLARELGFATFAIGITALLSSLLPGWTAAAACVGGVFLGLCGLNHARQPGRNLKQNIAMVSDLWAALVLLVGLVISLA